jgi:hypothetical protein
MGGIPVTERVILRAAAEDPLLGLASLVDIPSAQGQVRTNGWELAVHSPHRTDSPTLEDSSS